MAVIDSLIYYLRVLMIVVVIVLVAITGGLYYLLKVKKIAAREEKIDYDTFHRRNVLDYVKFDNIVSEEKDSLTGPGMVVVGNNTFIGGISISGYSLSTASVNEQQRTMANGITFWNVVSSPVQIRQTVTAVDLSGNIDEYEKILLQASEEGVLLQDEYDECVRLADDYVDSPEEYAAYEKQLMKLQKAIAAKKHSIEEARAVIKYMRMMTGDKEAQKVHQLIYSYTYNPDESTEELSKEEIYLKAFNELRLMGEVFKNEYARCGCTCKRLSASDFVLLFRKHLHPHYSDEISMDDIFNSSYNALFVTSDSLVELEKEKIGEEEYNRRLQLLYAKQEEHLKNLQREKTKEVQVLLDATHSIAQAQLQAAN